MIFIEGGRLSFFAILMAAMMMTGMVKNISANQEINYRLKWLINMSAVGDVYAQSEGLFAREGLSVTLRAGGPERDAIRELELGHAAFGVASADQVIHALSKGSPVVVIAQLFQSNPLRWIYFQDKYRIETLADLKAKTIGVTYGKNDEVIMRTLLSIAGIAEKEVRLFSVRLDYTPFFTGRAALWPVYVNSQGVELGQRLAMAGNPIAFLDPEEFGVYFVANSVVTSERMMTENPELVDRFRSALLEGWAAAIQPDNSAKAVAAVLQFDRDTTPEILHAQLTATRRLIQPNDGVPVGWINVAAWEQTEQIMLRYGQIDRPINVAEHLMRAR